jgi:hypothetical protein
VACDDFSGPTVTVAGGSDAQDTARHRKDRLDTPEASPMWDKAMRLAVGCPETARRREARDPMADREQPGAAADEPQTDEPQTDEPQTDEPPAPGETAGPDALAGAEEAAAREAEVEASEAAPAPAPAGAPAAATGSQDESAPPEHPKVVRPKATTSRKASPASPRPAAASRPGSDASVTVIEPSSPGRRDGLTRLDSVSIREGGAQEVNATNVDVSRGGIGRAQATDIAVSQGGIGLARGERVSVEMGAIGAALGNEVRVTQGAVGTVLARDVRIEQAAVRTIVANNVRFERTTGVLLLVARRVEGDVRTLLDWRGALAFGAAFGAVVALFRRRK